MRQCKDYRASRVDNDERAMAMEAAMAMGRFWEVEQVRWCVVGVAFAVASGV